MIVRTRRPARQRRGTLPHRRRREGQAGRSARRLGSQPWIAFLPPDLLELVAHELRTPITSLYGATRLLERNGLGAWTRDDLVAEMAADATRLVRFLEDLLALADASAGAISVEPVLAHRILDEVVARVRQDHPEARIDVRAGGAGVVALADPEALRHALHNLLGHAVRAANDDRPVTVAIDGDGGRVVTTVQEQLRRPVPEDDLIDRRDPLVEPGGRLWLASAQALVIAMGGELDVVRRGSQRILRVTLPRVASVEE